MIQVLSQTDWSNYIVFGIAKEGSYVAKTKTAGICFQER